jgi:hypothetical protein
LPGKIGGIDAFEVCGAVVLMVMVAVTGAESVIEMEAGIVQVGTLDPVAEKLFGVQVRFTRPVKDPAGVKVSVEAFPVVAPGAEMVTGSEGRD